MWFTILTKHPCFISMCNSLASVPLLAPTWIWTRDPLCTSTAASHEILLHIAPRKPRTLQSKGNNYFKVSERVKSPLETLLARTTANQLAISHLLHRNTSSDLKVVSRQTAQAVKSKALLLYNVVFDENSNASVCHLHEVGIITCSTT